MELNNIRIEVPSAVQAMAFKDQLLLDGLVWDHDFVWKYYPQQMDWHYNNHQLAVVEFKFRDASLATYYRMKWA